MGLKINIEGVPTDFSDVKRHNYEGSITFELSPPDMDVGILFPFPFPIATEIPPQKSPKVFIFKNKYFKANDVIQFRIEKEYLKNKKAYNGHIGYFFPVQLFLEEENIIEENLKKEPYLPIYILFAIEAILENKEGIVSLSPQTLNQEEIDSEIHISNLYDNDAIILVINLDLLDQPDEFDIDRYLCDLYKYGFYSLIEHETEISYNELDIIEDNFDDARKQSPRKFINVKTSSPDIDFQNPKSYYKILLHQLITQKSEFITSFITLYQVIELLKDNVLHNEMKALVLKPYPRGYEIEQAVKELSKTLTLLKKLLSSGYSRLSPQIVNDLANYLNTVFEKISEPTKKEADTSKLIDDLKDILSKHQGHPRSKGRKSLHDDILNKLHNLEKKAHRENFAPLLYLFRNKMVHDYSRVIQEDVDDDLLNDIQMRFEYLIIELIRTYHIKAKT